MSWLFIFCFLLRVFGAILSDSRFCRRINCSSLPRGKVEILDAVVSRCKNTSMCTIIKRLPIQRLIVQTCKVSWRTKYQSLTSSKMKSILRFFNTSLYVAKNVGYTVCIIKRVLRLSFLVSHIRIHM